MNVLILYPFAIKRGALGGNARMYRLLRFLNQQGHNVWLAWFRNSEEDTEIASELLDWCCEIMVAEIDGRSPYKKAIDFIISPNPSYVSHFASADMRDKLRSIFDKHSIDLMHIEFTYLADYVKEAKRAGCPAVLVEQELNMHALERVSAAGINSLRSIKNLRDRRRCVSFEKQAVKLFNRVMMISADEKNVLQTVVAGLDVGIYPNTVDMQFFKPQICNSASKYKDIFFIGNFQHYPNVDGIAWFIQKVFPMILAREPGCRLVIAGANATKQIKEMDNERTIRVIGYVDDVRIPLAQCSVFISPMINGGGMRGKVLEAMAMSKPVVTTSIGAEGIEAQNGGQLLICNKPREFAEMVIALLRDEKLAERLGNEARKLIEAKYNDEVVFPELERVYQDVVESDRHG